jgi:hypothetical protein
VQATKPGRGGGGLSPPPEFLLLTVMQNGTYVRSTMNNDRLSSLALMHIHRDFSVDLDRVMEKFVSAKTRRIDLHFLLYAVPHIYYIKHHWTSPFYLSKNKYILVKYLFQA